jgi:hypothetical protein
MGIAPVICLLFALSAQSAAPGQPRTIELTFNNGRIWVTARKATLAQILAAWTRAGQTRFEGIEKAPNQGPLDVQLAGVVEEEALQVLLRQAGGYTAVLRDSAGPMESTFARVLIVGVKPGAPSAMPAPDPPSEPEPDPVQRRLSPDGSPVPDDQQEPPPFRSMPPGFAEPPDTPRVRE